MMKRTRKEMATWTKEEIQKIAGTDDLHISPFRSDGKTYSTATVRITPCEAIENQ